MKKSLFINGQWQSGHDEDLTSADPTTGEKLWHGGAASIADVEQAFNAAAAAFKGWSETSIEDRIKIVERFADIAAQAKSEMGLLIAKETGKTLWDATGEAGAIAAKAAISVTAYKERTGALSRDTAFGRAELRHRAHGAMAILGPYNFPAHLPNGQILPALIAGNTVVFKPSEQCPAVGEALIKLYDQAGFPPGVINLVQGARQTGAAVLDSSKLAGVLFTGSPGTGKFIHKKFGGRPDIILALEMGGNNPLIIWDVDDVKAAASIAVQSAFITSGQRCTCARRIIVPDNPKGEAIIEQIQWLTRGLTLGNWQDGDQVSMGSVISSDVAHNIIRLADEMVEQGARIIKPARISQKGEAFVEPAIYDTTHANVRDEEIFGPVVQIIRAPNWDQAVDIANDTKYGLSAGLISERLDLWDRFNTRIRAGVVNFNRPTTGAASFLPFGGPGFSGNHNPGAYYSADFCAWPMASQVADNLAFMPMKGMS